MKSREYIYRGQVERMRPGRGYQWVDGWSAYADGEARRGILFPWLTRREAQADARRHGVRPVFVREETR